MNPTLANHRCLVCGRATSRCQTAWYSTEQPTAVTETRSDIPAEESSTRSEQLRPAHDRFALRARPVRAAEPSLIAEINGINGSTSGDTDGGSSNTLMINGSAPMSFDRNITIYGGQGGNGGDAGGTGGAGGVGQGNQLQIYLAGNDITLNVHYGSGDRDIDFVMDMLYPFDPTFVCLLLELSSLLTPASVSATFFSLIIHVLIVSVYFHSTARRLANSLYLRISRLRRSSHPVEH
ncbi:hypothetical protein C8R44DRAFT_984692 [Mycena epipterygia]|nr:hypothetical protein C8R44DRAFT_984692 [Mycena epipterygia]